MSHGTAPAPGDEKTWFNQTRGSHYRCVDHCDRGLDRGPFCILRASHRLSSRIALSPASHFRESRYRNGLCLCWAERRV